MYRIIGHKYAQAWVKVDNYEGDRILELYSYRTRVITYNVKTGIMVITGLYSATTRRHIGWFVNLVTDNIDYYQVKHAYEKNKGVLHGAEASYLAVSYENFAD